MRYGLHGFATRAMVGCVRTRMMAAADLKEPSRSVGVHFKHTACESSNDASATWYHNDGMHGGVPSTVDGNDEEEDVEEEEDEDEEDEDEDEELGAVAARTEAGTICRPSPMSDCLG